MSLRYILRLIEAFFKRFKAIIVVGFIAGIILFVILYFLLPNLDSTHEKIGMVGRFTPDNIPEEIASKISSGLTLVDANGNVNPAVSSSWESPDGGKTWIFTINEKLLWQDGRKITSKDINYQFSDAESEIVDDKTIKFKLNSAFSAFPVIVSKPIFKKGLVGNGEWKVKKISLAGGYLQQLVINRKSSKDHISNKITYKFYPSDDRLRLAFKLGEVDTIENVVDPAPFDSWKIVNIDKKIGYNNFVAVFFNTEDEKLSDKSVRQALAYSINKEVSGDKLSLPGERATGPISPYSWAYNTQVKLYTRDVEKAKDIKDLKIVLSTLPNLLPMADKIKKDWEEVGIACEIQVVSDVPDKYQAFLATVDIPKDPDQYSLWHSTQTQTNISRFKNARIDKLLEDGRTELDQELRKKSYLDFQRFLVEEVPAVFLYHPNLYTITRK